MDISSRLSSKGQVTVPKPVRDVLGMEPGDSLLFRVEGGRASLSKTGDFIAMAGTVPVPAAKRGTPWDEVLKEARGTRAERRH